jgi:hypothetical protein
MHWHSCHSISVSVSGVAVDGGQPGVLVCPIQSTGGAVSEVEGVLSVSFVHTLVAILLSRAPGKKQRK